MAETSRSFGVLLNDTTFYPKPRDIHIKQVIKQKDYPILQILREKYPKIIIRIDKYPGDRFHNLSTNEKQTVKEDEIRVSIIDPEGKHISDFWKERNKMIEEAEQRNL